MTTILNQPDYLSLSLNIKKFEITSSTEIRFKLSVGAVLLIDESYQPDSAGRIVIDIRDVVKNELAFSLPTTDIFQQTSICKSFTAEIGATSITFLAIRAGVENLSETPVNFLTANWLTWQPQSKKTSYYQPEWLTYYATVAGVVKVKFYLENTTTPVVVLHNIAAGTCYTYNVNFAHIMSLQSGSKYGYFDVWVETTTGDRLTYIQRYVFSEAESLDEFFLFENSLGGLDTALMTGDSSFAPELVHESGTYNDETVQLDGAITRLRSKNTGWKDSGEAAWLWDFFTSRLRYKVMSGSLAKITLSESDIQDSTQEDMKAYTFTYRLAVDQGLLNLVRSTDPLPEDLEITTPEGLFFLAPRLSDFPSATADDTLLFPIQSPYSAVWQKLSWGAIWNILYNKVLESAIGLAVHVHANLPILSKLSEVGGKLFYNGAQVSEGGLAGKRTYLLNNATQTEKTNAYVSVDKSGLPEARKIPISELGVALGQTSTTAHRGDRGHSAYLHSLSASLLSEQFAQGMLIETAIQHDVAVDNYINIEISGFGKENAVPFSWKGQTRMVSGNFINTATKSFAEGEELNVAIFIHDSVIKIFVTSRKNSIINYYNIQATVRFGNSYINVISAISDAMLPINHVNIKHFKDCQEVFLRALSAQDKVRIDSAVTSVDSNQYSMWVGTAADLASIARDSNTLYFVTQ